MKISRRSVLHISGLAAAALALTGCSAAGSAALGGKLPGLLKSLTKKGETAASSEAASDMAVTPPPEGEPLVPALPEYDADILTGAARSTNSRPVAVMVNNIANSQRQNARPQRGIGSADLLIEAKVEGGITRLCAVETANILFPNAAHQFSVHDLREAGFGVFENHPVKELVKNEDFKKWITPGSGFVPEGAEPTEQFHARCSETLLKLFEYMIRMDVTEAACVTHGGVIMSMLSQRALPSRHPEQWMADPGCGYTVQTDVQLWMRDRLVEAIDIVPFGYADTLRGQAEAEENEAFE